MSAGVRESFEKVLGEVAAACRALFGGRLAALAVFGSVGRGTPRPDSDIDLLVVVDDLPSGRLARMELFRPIEQAVEVSLRRAQSQGVHTELSPVLKTPQEVEAGTPLLLDMVEDARILWDRDRFLEDRLDRLRRRLSALGAKRVPFAGAWYWDLKPDFRPGEVVEL